MLPDRSKRYASNAGELPRLRLATSWHLALVAALVISLLYVIFPKSALVEQLYQRDTLDDLSMAYIESLYRVDGRNGDAAILLAKYRVDDISLVDLQRMLEPFQNSEELRQRTQIRLTLARTLENALAKQPDGPEFSHLQETLRQLMVNAENDILPERLARQLGVLAFRLDLPELGERYLSRIAGGLSNRSLEQYGHDALSRQEYVLAARFFLMARDRARQTDEARRLFQLGIGTLMSASLYPLALASADQHLGDLEGDLPTLRYMARIALAAGEPVRAARFARRLVFSVAPDPLKP